MVPFPNEPIKQKMANFMDRHFLSIDILLEDKEEKYFVTLVPTDEFDKPLKRKIPVLGFNHNYFEIERIYVYRVCYWMAIMAGDTMLYGRTKEIPYLLCEGDLDDKEYWFLFINEPAPTDEKHVECIGVNEYGYADFPYNPSIAETKEEYKWMMEKIEQELLRLTKLWKERK